jgi:hypothetical protein
LSALQCSCHTSGASRKPNALSKRRNARSDKG